jgi:hypothetical protein
LYLHFRTPKRLLLVVRFLQDQGVPKALLDFTTSLRFSHVSVPATWLRWALQGSAAASKGAADTTGAAGVDFLEGLETEEDELNPFGDTPAAAAKKPALTGPYDASSAAVAEKVKGELQELGW